MRALLSILIGILAFFPSIQAQNSSTSNPLPQCAELCVEAALPKSRCSNAAVLDPECLCTDITFNNAVSLCVESTCTIRETLTAQNISLASCNEPVRDKTKEFADISIVCAVFSGLAVLLRVLYRTWVKPSLGLDDIFIVGIFLLNLSICVINIIGLAGNGLGRDVWTVSFDKITALNYYSYIVTILYFACIPLIKISILIFYLRIFPEDTIRTFIHMTIIFNILYGIAYTFVGIFQCAPISFYWTSWDGEHAGKCLDTVAIVNSYSGIGIAVDLWMLILPTTQIIHLNLAWKKKLATAGMFGVGIIFTAVTAIRLAVLVPIGYATTLNPTWDYYVPGYISQLELTVGIICACLPSIRLLVVSFFAKSKAVKQASMPRSESRSASSSKPVQNWWEKSIDDLPPDYDDLGEGEVDRTKLVEKYNSFMYDVQKSLDDIAKDYNNDNEEMKR